MSYYRETWAEISLDAYVHNIRYFKSLLSKDCLLMAVVKADGYGHGAIEISRAAIEAGADYLGVAFLDEALQLRKAGIEKPILILGYTPPKFVKYAIENEISITVADAEVLDEMISGSQKLGTCANIHLKIDTGMTRLGLANREEIVALALKAHRSPFVNLVGAFTHFANADTRDGSLTAEQFERFMQVLQALKERQIDIPLKHCCNSAAALQFPAMHLDMVRIGISSYGFIPSRDMPQDYKLEPVMQFKTKIAALKWVNENQGVSYGHTYKTKKKTLVALLPVGYADGFPRLLSNQGRVLVNDHFAPIIGRVCMDQTMIDVTGIPGVKVGSEVVLFGKMGDKYLPADSLAEQAKTIHYEIVTGIGKRVPRVYVQNGKIVQTNNFIYPSRREMTIME